MRQRRTPENTDETEDLLQPRETAGISIGRLKKCDGESLAEALIAVLIMAFGALMLASMVQSSTRIVQTSNEGMTKVYNAEAEAADFMDGSTGTPGQETMVGGYVAIEGSGNTTFTQIGGTKLNSSGVGVQIYHDDYSHITVYRKTVTSGGGASGNP